MRTTTDMTDIDGPEVVDDLVDQCIGGPTIAAWLWAMWGTQVGESFLVSQVNSDDLGSGIGIWLHRLWGLAWPSVVNCPSCGAKHHVMVENTDLWGANGGDFARLGPSSRETAR